MPANVHQGFWLATAAQVRAAVQRRCLPASYVPHWYYLEREAAASELYFRCNMTKVVPIDSADTQGAPLDLEHFLVHHMDDTYAAKPQLSHDAAVMTARQLHDWVQVATRGGG